MLTTNNALLAAECRRWREECGSKDDRGWRYHPELSVDNEGRSVLGCVAMPEANATDRASALTESEAEHGA